MVKDLNELKKEYDPEESLKDVMGCNYSPCSLKQTDGIPVADCGNWGIWMHIREQKTGWSVSNTPYEAFFKKSQCGGYDNGPWPADDKKRVPLGHVKSVMDYEGLSFEDALKTQYNGIQSVAMTDTVFLQVATACQEAVERVRAKLLEEINLLSSEEVFSLARQLEIKTAELGFKPHPAFA